MSTLDTAETDRSSRTAAEWLWPLLPIGMSVFCISALLYLHMHREAVTPTSALQSMIAGLYRTFGLAPAVIFFILTATWGTIWFVTGKLERPLVRLGRLLAMAVMLGVFLNLGDGGVTPAVNKGVLGAWLAGALVAAVGYFPSIVLVWAITFASLLLATDFFFSESFERLRPRPQATETGVENAVTDHLRGLGTVLPSGPVAAPVEPAGAKDFAAIVDEAPPAHATAPVSVAEPVEPADDPIAPPEPPVPPMPRSYFERRWANHAAPAVASVDDTVSPEVDGIPLEAGDARPAAATGPVVVGDEGGAGEAWLAGGAANGPSPSSDEPDAIPPSPLSAYDEVSEPVFVAGTESAGEPASELVGEPASEPAIEGFTEPVPESPFTIPQSVLPPQAAAALPSVAPVAPAEPIVAIPRPEVPSVRQQGLFDANADEALVAEAIELVTGTRRVTATLLQRRLRIDYPQALDLLAQLAARGVVELEADASQGRVVT